MTAVRGKQITFRMTLTNGTVTKAVQSYTMSSRYINTMLRATVINILYHRLKISDKEFMSKEFQKVAFKVPRPKSNHPVIRNFHMYMAACKDAVEKNYLRHLYMYFIDSATGEVLEHYKFSFKYADQDDETHDQTSDALKAHTRDILQTLGNLEKHNKLIADIHIKVEFTYFADTPAEYEPPGFESIDESESLFKKLSKKGNTVTLGTLYTGFHRLECSARGRAFDLSNPSTQNEQVEDQMLTEDVMEAPDEVPMLTEDFTEDFVRPFSPTDQRNTSLRNPTSPSELRNTLYDSLGTQCIEISSEEESELLCMCKLPVDELEIDVVACSTCKRRYHACCQGYLDKTYVDFPFNCSFCRSDENMITSLDARLAMPLSRVRDGSMMINESALIQLFEFKYKRLDTTKLKVY